MRLKLILPAGDPEQFDEPRRCCDPKCGGKRFLPWQEVKKNVRASEYEEVPMTQDWIIKSARAMLFGTPKS